MLAYVQHVKENAGLPDIERLQENIERIWAYLKIQQLLKNHLETTGNKEELNKQALELSLKVVCVKAFKTKTRYSNCSFCTQNATISELTHILPLTISV